MLLGVRASIHKKSAGAALAAFLLVCVAAPSARAVGTVSTVSPRPMGMGGAFMAVDDELAAMAWNPAGMAPPRCRSANGLRFDINVLGAPSIAAETGLLTGVESEQFASLHAIEKLATAIGCVAKSVRVRTRGVAFGVLFLEEHLDPQGLARSRRIADAEDLLDGYYTTVAFAFRLAPSASIGMSQVVFSGLDEGGGRSTAYGRSYGAVLRPNEFLTVGLTYLDTPPDFQHYRLSVEGLGTRTMNAGVAYRPWRGTLLTLDLRDLSETHPETSMEPRLGLEWNAPGRVAVRAGAYREDSGRTDVLTLGLGAIPRSVCPESGPEFSGDSYTINYAVLLADGVGPRHLLSAVLHF
jgi:hypothetical protein